MPIKKVLKKLKNSESSEFSTIACNFMNKKFLYNQSFHQSCETITQEKQATKSYKHSKIYLN